MREGECVGGRGSKWRGLMEEGGKRKEAKRGGGEGGG